jgi:hypothetical protein
MSVTEPSDAVKSRNGQQTDVNLRFAPSLGPQHLAWLGSVGLGLLGFFFFLEYVLRNRQYIPHT